MTDAMQTANTLSKADPTWLLAFLLVCLVTLNGVVARMVFNVVFRQPNLAANDKGGLAYEIKDALIQFVANVDSKIVKCSDSVREMQSSVNEMKSEIREINNNMPTVCRAGK